MKTTVVSRNEGPRIATCAESTAINDNLVCVGKNLRSALPAFDLILHVNARIDRSDRPRGVPCRAPAFCDRQSNRWTHRCAAGRASETLNKTSGIHLSSAQGGNRAINVVTQSNCFCEICDNCCRTTAVIDQTWLRNMFTNSRPILTSENVIIT